MSDITVPQDYNNVRSMTVTRVGSSGDQSGRAVGFHWIG